MAASTGSPASRRLTKLTPLTTRPSLTSRHGMTRTLNISCLAAAAAVVLRRAAATNKPQRRGGIEPSIVQRPPRNGAGKLAGARLHQGAHVVEGRESA